jgi:hypothetical protein
LEVAYQDYTGSGAETAAHLRENGRVVIMFCAFDGPPKIVRLHGRGRVVTAGEPGFDELASRFPSNAGTRSFIHIQVSRVSASCGYSVPRFDPGSMGGEAGAGGSGSLSGEEEPAQHRRLAGV